MSKKSKVKISKLVLEIGSKKIELTMKQAKELQEVLNDSFGDTEVVFRDRWYTNYPWNSPITYYSSGTATGISSTNVISGGTALCGSFQGSALSGALAGDTMTLTVQ